MSTRRLYRASAFVVERVKICITYSWITMQNLVVVSHIVYAHVGGVKRLSGRWGPAPFGCGRGWPLEISFSPPVLPCQIQLFYNVRAYLWRSGGKFWLPIPCFPRSLKLIGNDTDRSATYDFLLVFRNSLNYSPVSYRFRDKWQYLPNFPILLYLTPPVTGFSLEFCNGAEALKTKTMPLSECGKIWRYFHSFWHNTGIGQMDRQNW